MRSLRQGRVSDVIDDRPLCVSTACGRVCPVCDRGVPVQSYYPFAVAQLQQPGFSAVSTPTHTRNQPAATDFLDIGNFARERVHLTAVGADGKFALNSSAFMARGYSLWRVLRRMEMENVDTAYLGWISYAMHIESRQATLAAMTTNAPITSILAPTHPPTVLSQVRSMHAAPSRYYRCSVHRLIPVASDSVAHAM